MSSDRSDDFRLAAGRGYLMDSGNLEAVRLNYRFYLRKETLSFNIHPSIPKESLQAVADVATGTGIWLLEVCKELTDTTSATISPSSSSTGSPRRLDGFDIDLTQVPHAAWLPPDINFHHWNVFDEPSTHLHGVYDLVHVRLLVLVLEGAVEARLVIRNLLRLLKPGGFLQWDELDVANMAVRQPPESTATASESAPALHELMEKSRAGGRYDWTVGLGDLVAEEGFEMVLTQKFGDPDRLVRMFHEQHLLTMGVFGMGLEKIGKTDAAARFAELVAAGHREARKGTVLCFPRLVVVARKKTTAI